MDESQENDSIWRETHKQMITWKLGFHLKRKQCIPFVSGQRREDDEEKEEGEMRTDEWKFSGSGGFKI